MFGAKARKAEVIRHWYSLVPGFNTSAQDFYKDLQQELTERKVPGLQISQVEFFEGGLLSDKREYLRMCRERLVFDVCAAPYGTSFFFSCRFAEIPATVRVWQLILLTVTFYIIVALFWRFAGFWNGSLIFLIALCLAIYTVRNAVALGLRDLDATLVRSPLLGPLYERFFRKETYYREDTRLMYCDMVNEIVKTRVEIVTAAKGVKLIRFNDFNPILAELYKPSMVDLPRPSA